MSLDHPEALEEGMVFALETYWPAADGWAAARIEEELVVTADGLRGHHQVPGRGAARRGQRYFTTGGPLPTCATRQSHLNTRDAGSGRPR